MSWSIDAISGSTFSWAAPGNTGPVVVAHFTGLPSHNSDFGRKSITVTVTHPQWSRSKSADFEVFFPKGETNHPAPTASWQKSNFPNWLYYWGQLRPPTGDSVEYKGINPPNTDSIKTESDSEEVKTTQVHQWIWSGAGEGSCNTISEFLALMSHENYHVTQRKTWWPNGYLDPNYADGNDSDHDYVPDDTIEDHALELQHEDYTPICSGYTTSRPYEEYLPIQGNNDFNYITDKVLIGHPEHDRTYWEEQGWRKEYKGMETD